MKNQFNREPFFKGWAKPGPWVPVFDAAEPHLSPSPDETLDALCGHFRIFQLKKGHRFSTDDVLTAWYGTSWCPSAQKALDLGSGIGSVGMIAAWRLQGTQFVTIEAQEVSVALAKRSARLNGLEKRYEIRQGDFRTPQCLDPNEKFDLILGSPPYFPLKTGVLGNHAQKITCRFEVRGSILDYCEHAARHLQWGGLFACVFPIHPPEQLQRIQQAARSYELTMVRYRPVILKEGAKPLLGLFGMTRKDHLPAPFRDQTWIDPPLVVRTKTGEPHPEYSALKLAIGLPPTG